jgi:hypothetical protein
MARMKRDNKQFSVEEQIARDALMRFNQEATNINIWNIIPDFLDGTMCLVEFDSGGNRQMWSVFVKNGRGQVYMDWEEVFRVVAGHQRVPRFSEWLTSREAVIAIISFFIVIASFVSLFMPNKDIGEWAKAPLGVVLGFWFGRGYSPQASIDRRANKLDPSASHPKR